jgi:hypothetical protein
MLRTDLIPTRVVAATALMSVIGSARVGIIVLWELGLSLEMKRQEKLERLASSGADPAVQLFYQPEATNSNTGRQKSPESDMIGTRRGDHLDTVQGRPLREEQGCD